MPNAWSTVVNSGSLDAGTAVLLDNHVRAVYSKEIEYKAQPLMRFMQFARQKTELGVQPGLTIQIMTYANLTRGGALVEGVRMGTQNLSASMKSITVGERGNAVAMTELAMRASFTDLMADATTLLARDLAITTDCELRDVVLAGATIGGVTTPKIYGRADKNAAKINSRASITATNVLSVATVKDAVELLATANAPKIQAAFYICFCHPHQSRALRDDPAWIEASKYGAPDQLFTGEIGRIDDVRFIETTLMCNGADVVGGDAYKAALVHGANGAPADIDVYQAVVMAEGYFGFAMSLPAELRTNGVVDFQRERALAWYGIWGSAVLQPNYAVIIETA